MEWGRERVRKEAEGGSRRRRTGAASGALAGKVARFAAVIATLTTILGRETQEEGRG